MSETHDRSQQVMIGQKFHPCYIQMLLHLAMNKHQAQSVQGSAKMPLRCRSREGRHDDESGESRDRHSLHLRSELIIDEDVFLLRDRIERFRV